MCFAFLCFYVKRGKRVILVVDLEDEEGKGRLCEVNYVNGDIYI